MKFSLSVIALCIGSSAALAPRDITVLKRHLHKRDVATVQVTVTSTVYDDASATPVAPVAPAGQNKAVQQGPPPSSKPPAAPAPAAPSSAPAPAPSSAPAANSGGSSGGINGDLQAFVNPTQQFQDGVHDCSSVPTGQGVITLDWLGYNGWSGIMKNDNTGAGANSCTEGYLCSYACQSGMSKTQWPSDQPADGQSRGGLLCKGGKLYRTNTNNNFLCEWGKQSANAVSKLDKVVSICRTDYPGTESMVIPSRLTAGSTIALAVPDEDSYYKWQGKPTSAQYYVNNAGVDVQQGCVWSTAGTGLGNWAPVNLGAGFSNGITYLSIIPNPNNKTPPNYSVKIEAASGSSVNGNCKYENGAYNGAAGSGCTVSVTSGSGNFVFY